MRARALSLIVVGVLVLAGCIGTGSEPSATEAADESTGADSFAAITEAPASTVAETTSTAPPTTVAAITTTTTTAPTTTTRVGVETLAAGLFCRDLAPLGYTYSEVVAYWISEGSPDRMDADRNGIPCETVYAETDVLAFWGDPLPTTTVGGIEAHEFFAPPDPWDYPHQMPAGSGTYGSGCSPGTTALPDGIWFGFITGYGETNVDFDLACLIAPSPDEEGGASVRNENPGVRVVPVRDMTMVHYIDGGWVTRAMPYHDWRTRGCTGEVDPCPVWLYVNGGEATAMAEHFFTG